MTNLFYEQAIREELISAQIARAQGNEGRARVCARGAAGFAIGAYIQRNNLPNPGPSALDRLNLLRAQSDISSDLQISIQSLTQRVNENFELPEGIDLITEARKLITTLLPDFEE